MYRVAQVDKRLTIRLWMVLTCISCNAEDISFLHYLYDCLSLVFLQSLMPYKSHNLLGTHKTSLTNAILMSHARQNVKVTSFFETTRFDWLYHYSGRCTTNVTKGHQTLDARAVQSKSLACQTKLEYLYCMDSKYYVIFMNFMVYH